MWICEDNDCTIRETIEASIFNYKLLLIKENKLKEVSILRDINIQFIQILREKSRILINYTREWELLRGIYNNNFNHISKDKDYKMVIDELWFFCYESIRTNIWNKRCEEVIRLEKLKGVGSADKKKRKLEEGTEGNSSIKNNNSK